MARITDIPEEVLLMIFKELDDDDVENCQYVCRAWYTLGHILVLKEISLWSSPTVESFIKSIDHNPKTSYLKAVKKISVHISSDEITSRLSKTNLKKLFFRFPNLEEVYFHASLVAAEDFDNDICEGLLSSCPRLKKFTASNRYNADSEYFDLINKLRLLVTTIDAKMILESNRVTDNMLQYITTFPRLNEITGRIQVDNIQSFLPVLPQIPTLTTLTLACRKDDQLGFSENLVTSDQHVSQLANIEDLTLILQKECSLNSLIFVSKYMTGLKDILISNFFLKSWTDVNQRLFCNYALDMVNSIATGRLELTMKLETLAEYLSIIIHKTFHRTADGKKPTRTLQIAVKDKKNNRTAVDVIVNSEEPK